MDVYKLLKVDLNWLFEYFDPGSQDVLNDLVIVQHSQVVLLLQQQPEIFVVLQAYPIGHDDGHVLDSRSFVKLYHQLLIH